MLGSKSEKVYTRLYLNKLESTMRALSDALPTGHWAMANPDASIAFWLRMGHSASKPLPQLAIREDAICFVQNWTKKLFFANKDPKTNFADWMILRKHVLSFKCNDFFKMANLKAILSSATLIRSLMVLLNALSWMKIAVLGFKFQWGWFLRV